MENNIEDITLEELNEIAPISIRAFHILKTGRLNTLVKIINYYNQNHSFVKIKNCGNKSNLELTNLCEKYRTGQLIEEIKQSELGI
jgi:hypothetical protein